MITTHTALTSIEYDSTTSSTYYTGHLRQVGPVWYAETICDVSLNEIEDYSWNVEYWDEIWRISAELEYKTLCVLYELIFVSKVLTGHVNRKKPASINEMPRPPPMNIDKKNDRISIMPIKYTHRIRYWRHVNEYYGEWVLTELMDIASAEKIAESLRRNYEMVEIYKEDEGYEIIKCKKTSRSKKSRKN